MPWCKMSDGKFIGFNYNTSTDVFKVYGVSEKPFDYKAIPPTDPNLFEVEIPDTLKAYLKKAIDEDWGKVAIEKLNHNPYDFTKQREVFSIEEIMCLVFNPDKMSELHDAIVSVCNKPLPTIDSLS